MAAQAGAQRGARTGSGAKLKNYRSQSEISTILEAIRQYLVTHGARYYEAFGLHQALPAPIVQE